MQRSEIGLIDKQRIWEIDFIRGQAVIVMFFYHIVFDLINVAGQTPFVGDWLWRWGPELIAGVFLLTAGLSTAEVEKTSNINLLRITWKRALKIYLFGFIVSSFMYFATPHLVIIFGILQCIATVLLLGHLFVKMNDRSLLITGIVIVVLGNVLDSMGVYNLLVNLVNQSLLSSRTMADFFPLIPWLGYYLIGIYLGRTKMSSVYGLFGLKKAYSPVIFLGQYSIWVYVIHQPIILLSLNLLGFNVQV